MSNKRINLLFGDEMSKKFNSISSNKSPCGIKFIVGMYGSQARNVLHSAIWSELHVAVDKILFKII